MKHFGSKPRTRAQKQTAAFLQRVLTDKTPIDEIEKRWGEYIEGKRG